jgi:ubiquinone/menaquinone biosynthesis C-methylase UbiE
MLHRAFCFEDIITDSCTTEEKDNIQMQRKSDRPTSNATIDAINHWYDKVMFGPNARKRYAGSDFHNYGYWDQGTRTAKEACENLMEKLLALIPKKEGTILDVACGKGATTRHLLKYYQAKDVIGINISEKQLERCKVNAPGCQFLLMDATELKFKEESFDNVICVEAAFHFNTREKFLCEAYRVLKPGGYLMLSDIVRRYQKRRNPRHIAENYVEDLSQYRNLYLKSEFEQVQIIDATFECWVGFRRHALQFLRNRFRMGEIDRPTFIQRSRCIQIAMRRSGPLQALPYYLLVSARKADL